jgi:iron complex outermembrane receptor protein
MLQPPEINPLQPCLPSGCGSNSAAFPDQAGNPALRPEVSTGLDLSFEHYEGKTGVLSVNLFVRQIDEHIREDTRLDTVDWSPNRRWVTRSYNVGMARTMGIELDARGRLNEWLAEAPAVEINAGLNLFRSSVGSLPGPHNRLAEQPRANAKLSLQYQLPQWPWRLGTQLNWTSATPVRVAEQDWRDNGRRFSASFTALWTIDKDQRLRLSYSPPQTSQVQGERLTASERILSQREQRNAAGWGLKWETKI